MVRYRENYDNLVLQMMFRKNKSGEYSATDIYHIIRIYGRPKGKKRVPGKDTVQRHINRMVEGNQIVIRRKGGLFNKTLYKLSPRVIAFFNKREFN
jgi:hypothetical protein